MSITLHLPPELQEQLSAEASRRNQRVEDVALSAIADSFGSSRDTKQENIEQWQARFQAWIASHRPIPHFVDDSRASVYDD
jgi:predicted transcriptional regulator